VIEGAIKVQIFESSGFEVVRLHYFEVLRRKPALQAVSKNNFVPRLVKDNAVALSLFFSIPV